jgi:hypothetical protein
VKRAGVFAAVLFATTSMSAFAQGSPIVSPPQPPPQNVTVQNNVTVTTPPMDPVEVSNADEIANQSFIVNTVQPVPVEWVNDLCSLPNIWTTTPPDQTYNSTDLSNLANLVLTAALALIGLAFAGAGIEVLCGADPQEKLSRVGLAAVLAVGNQLWWRLGIDLNNALTAVIGPPDMCGSLIKPHIALVKPTPAPGVSVAEPVLVIVYAIVSLVLLFACWFRLGWIDVLFVAGPLALMCWGSEEAVQIARWYQRISIGTLFGQVLLAIGLRAAQVTGSNATGVAAVLVALVILWICKQLLTTLSSQVVSRGNSLGSAAVGMLARRLIFKVL